MNPLARLDLSRFRIDSESFVGQAIALGVRFEKLPPQTAEALLGFLRAKGLYYGRRNRSGIAIAREGLELGVRQALICLDMGLKDRAEGDLNRAVDLLAQGDFEAYRKHGYERAFFRLLDMQKGSVSLLMRPESEFLQTEHRNLKRWAQVVPETWTRPPDDLEEREQLVDPRTDYDAFLTTQARLDFLRSIPGGALQSLQQAVDEGRTFDGLLRNLVLALALDLETLMPSSAQIAAFGKTCFEEGALTPDVRDKVSGLMAQQLESSVDDADFRAQIREAFEEEMTFLEQVAGEDMATFFLLPGLKPATADDLLGEAPIM